MLLRTVALPCANPFVEATELRPFGDDDVAVFVEGATVGGIDDAFFPFGGGKAVVGAVFFVGLVAELGGDVAGFVEKGDTALEFGEEGVVAADVDSGGHAKVFLNDADEFAVEVPVFDAVVVSVADEEVVVARIVGDAVAGFELPFGFARATKGFHEFTVLIEFQDVVGAVTIGHKDGAIGRHGDGARVEAFGVFENVGFCRVFQGPHRRAIEVEFLDMMLGWAGGVDVFGAVFVADLKGVDVAGADRAKEFAGRTKDNDASRRIGCDIDVAGLVDGSAAEASAERGAAGSLLEEVGDVFEIYRRLGGGERRDERQD